MAFSLIFRSFDKEENQKYNERSNHSYYNGSLFCSKIIGVLHCKQVWKHFKIGVAEWSYTVGKDDSVDCSEENPESGDQNTKLCSCLKQVNN